MARGGINKAVVQQAVRALTARGEYPSIDAVRVELGNTGSKSTIHRYLKEIDADSHPEAAAGRPLGEELGALVAQLAERLESDARAAVADERAALAEERAGYLQRLQQAEARIGQLEGDNRQLGSELQVCREAFAEGQNALQQARIDCARLQQSEQALGERLADRAAQLHSLEEKHRHAREALEHYRQASREQREQEQRRHETQVQQLQMEIRQLQQSLAVRQDELTRLNRDNERLVTEARQHLHDRQTQARELERSEAARQALLQRLQQADEERGRLAARVEDLQAECSRLTSSLDRQWRHAETLQDSLAALTAQLARLQRQEDAPGEHAENAVQGAVPATSRQVPAREAPATAGAAGDDARASEDRRDE